MAVIRQIRVTYPCLHAYMHVHMHMRVQPPRGGACMHAYMHMCICLCMFACICVCSLHGRGRVGAHVHTCSHAWVLCSRRTRGRVGAHVHMFTCVCLCSPGAWGRVGAHVHTYSHAHVRVQPARGAAYDVCRRNLNLGTHALLIKVRMSMYMHALLASAPRVVRHAGSPHPARHYSPR